MLNLNLKHATIVEYIPWSIQAFTLDEHVNDILSDSVWAITELELIKFPS